MNISLKKILNLYRCRYLGYRINNYFIFFVLILSNFCAAAETVTVGIVCPLTTSSKSFGIGHLQGITLAIDEFNSNNHNVKVNVDIVDDQSNSLIARAAVKRLEVAGAAAIFGPCNSSVADTLLSSGDFSLPVISALTTATNLTEVYRNPFFFRMNVSDKKRMAAFLESIFLSDGAGFRPDNLLVLYEDNDAYGEGLVNNVEEWLSAKESAFYSANFIKYPYKRDLLFERAKDLLSSLNLPGDMKEPHSIILLGLAADAMKITSAIKRKGWKSKIYLPEPEQNAIQSAISAGVNVGGVKVFSVWDPNDTSINNFSPIFRRKFAEDPTFAATSSYDAAKIFLWALKRSYQTNIGIADLRMKIRDSMANFNVEDALLVLHGNQKMVGNEYVDLYFRGLQISYDGRLLSWNEKLPDPPLPIQINSGIAFPGYKVYILVLLSGFLGGFIRETHSAKSTDPLREYRTPKKLSKLTSEVIHEQETNPASEQKIYSRV